MTRLALLFLALAAPVPAISQTADAIPGSKASIVIVPGAAGDDSYAPQFLLWAQQWKNAATEGGLRSAVVGHEPAQGSDKTALAKALEEQEAAGAEPLWIVLLGHGTSDGKEAKFNLRGDDVSATEFAGWLKRFERPLVVVASFATSGAWLAPLSAPGRVIVTATRSGGEENFSRLSEYLPGKFTDPTADLDKDGQTSLLEAWLTAAKATADFYANEGRLATEHSLLEDNGDGKGTPPDFFQGTRAVKRNRDNAPADGLRAHQLHLVPNPAEKALPGQLRQDRDALELEIAKLREGKAGMEEATYYKRLEELLLRLARLYEDRGS